MSELATVQSTLPVALVYGEPEACAHLRTALNEFNADIVYDSIGEAVDQQALGQSGAKVAVVNLDDTLDPKLDDIYAILEACGCRVVFNDPGSSVTLEGWEHARWVRHLAAKLRDDVDVDPPRPADAEPVNVTEASQLGNQWLDEALDVLTADSDAPQPAAEVPSLPSAAAALELPDIALTEAATSPRQEAGELTPPMTAIDDVADTSTAALEADAHMDFTPASDELDGLRGPVAEADADDEPDGAALDALEQQLASSFVDEAETPDVSMRGAKEANASQASALPEAADLTLDEQAFSNDELSIDWTLLDDDSAAPLTLDAETHPEPVAPALDDVALGLDDMLASNQLPREDEHKQARQGDVESTLAFASNPLAEEPHVVVPPVSEWTLFDDTLEPPAAGLSHADSDEAVQTRVPGEALANALADRDFGIELVDPIEYLAPEAPPRETELYNAVELVSMADALAPQQIDENIHAEAVAEPLPRVVVLCASIGGPDAVREFLACLPAGFPALFVLAQHMGSEFIDLMVNQLGKAGAMPVRVPTSGERAVAGELLVVPNGAQLVLSRKGAISMTTSPGSNESDPSVEHTMSMAATVFAADTLAIIFSGMIGDVVAGTAAVVKLGGAVWTQDPSTCVVSTMVDNVTAAGDIEFCATPSELAQHLIETFSKRSAP